AWRRSSGASDRKKYQAWQGHGCCFHRDGLRGPGAAGSVAEGAVAMIKSGDAPRSFRGEKRISTLEGNICRQSLSILSLNCSLVQMAGCCAWRSLLISTHP